MPPDTVSPIRPPDKTRFATFQPSSKPCAGSVCRHGSPRAASFSPASVKQAQTRMAYVKPQYGSKQKRRVTTPRNIRPSGTRQNGASRCLCAHQRQPIVVKWSEEIRRTWGRSIEILNSPQMPNARPLATPPNRSTSRKVNLRARKKRKPCILTHTWSSLIDKRSQWYS